MATIEVRPAGEDDKSLSYRVTVRDGDGETHHEVTVSREDFLRLGAGYDSSERFIRACFEFLLEREPPTSIMSRFDVSVIGRYFPEFERKIARPTG